MMVVMYVVKTCEMIFQQNGLHVEADTAHDPMAVPVHLWATVLAVIALRYR